MTGLHVKHEKWLLDSLANGWLAEPRASALAAAIHEIRAAGFVTWRAMALELNRRGTPTARGGRWHCTSVGRVLARLGMTTTGARGGNGARAIKRAADVRAKALAHTIHELQAAGFVSNRAIAHELNVRRIPAVRGGKWHQTGVGRLLDRLKKQATYSAF
jgi:hypothetical protein